MASTPIETKELNSELQNKLRSAFIHYFEKAYEGWSEERLGFPPNTLKNWLETQFDQNVGDWFIVYENCSNSFITFTPTDSFINIYQLIGNETERIALMKAVVALYPEKPFYGVVRKQNKAAIDFFVSQGCKIVDNRFPNYSSDYYCGLEMSVEALRSITGGN